MAATASEASCSDAEPEPEDTDTAAASSDGKGGLRELLRIAIPTALANLAEYLPVSVALYFIGRRGSADDLDDEASAAGFGGGDGSGARSTPVASGTPTAMAPILAAPPPGSSLPS